MRLVLLPVILHSVFFFAKYKSSDRYCDKNVFPHHSEINNKIHHDDMKVSVFDTIKTKNKRDTDKTKSPSDTDKIKKVELKQVLIKGKKVYIIQHVDKTVIQVENNEAFKGSSLDEILEKVPGVTIDGNNKLSINGTSSIKIQINGKDVPFDPSAINLLLKSIQSASIKQVEIVNPSAKQDAESSAKILNIVTVSQPSNGYSITAGGTFAQGVYPTEGINFFGQAKVGKLSLQLLTLLNGADQYSTSNYTRNYFDGNTLLVGDDKALNIQKSLFNEFSLNYSLNKKTNLGFSFSGNINSQNGNDNSSLNFKTGAGLDSTSANASLTTQSLTFLFYNLYLKQQLDTTGQILDINFDLNVANNKQNNLFNDILTYASTGSINSEETVNSEDNSSITIPAIRLDYTKPILKNAGTISFGLKYADAQNHETNTYLDQAQSSYQYNETVFAQYASFLYEKKMSSIQAGLRGENTNDNGTINGLGVTSRNYYDLFPSISLQQKLNKSQTIVLNLNYRRRIQRPSFTALSPFLYYTSPYDAYRGDETLSPTIIDDYSATLNIKGLYLNGYYSVLHNAITAVPLLTDSSKTVINQYINVALEHYTSLSISYPFTIGKISFNPNVNSVFTNDNTTIGNDPINKNLTNIVVNLNATYKFNKTSRLELRSFYEPKVETIYASINHKEGVTLRYIKTFFNGNLNCRITAEDIFNTNKESGINQLLGYQEQFSNFYDNRRLGISLTYSLRKGQRVSIDNKDDNGDNRNRIKTQ